MSLSLRSIALSDSRNDGRSVDGHGVHGLVAFLVFAFMKGDKVNTTGSWPVHVPAIRGLARKCNNSPDLDACAGELAQPA